MAVKGTPAVTNSAAAATSVPVNTPATTSGDTLLVAILRASNQSPTVPDGTWTKIFTEPGAGGTTSFRMDVYVKLNCPTAAAGTATFTSTQSRNHYAIAYTLDAVDSNLGNVRTQSQAAGGNTTITAPASTLTALAASNWFFFGGTQPGGTFTPDSDWTEDADADSTGTVNQVHMYAAHRAWPASGPVTDLAENFSRTPAGSAGTYPLVSVLLVDAATNIAPAVTVPSSSIVGQVGKQITLGPASATDPDGTIASYQWSQDTSLGTLRSAPALSGASTATATFTPTAPGAYTYKVTATDDLGAVSSPATVSVVVLPTKDALIAKASGWTRGNLNIQ